MAFRLVGDLLIFPDSSNISTMSRHLARDGLPRTSCNKFFNHAGGSYPAPVHPRDLRNQSLGRKFQQPVKSVDLEP